MNESDYSGRLAVLESRLVEGVQHLKERMDLKFEAAERARQIQFEEFMRRLSELNGEAGRLRSMQETYMPREVADAKQEDTNKALRSLELFQSNMLGRMAVIGVVSGIVTSMIIRWLRP